jgi:hypothetical protein
MSDADKINAKLEQIEAQSRREWWQTTSSIWEPSREARVIAALRIALEKLAWYATATYPDDGSGRPPDAYQRRANQGLHAIAEALAGEP